jgi:hypothetical protein
MQITPNGTGGATFTAQQIGTFQVPGTASATSGRKTFKTRGTLKSTAKLKDVSDAVGLSR